MYYPILRGKQFELIALRELSSILNPALVTPVIEPVRKSFSPLINTIKELNINGICPHIILNSSLGELNTEDAGSTFDTLCSEQGVDFTPCIKVFDKFDIDLYEAILASGRSPSFFITGRITPEMQKPLSGSPTTFINKEKIHPMALKGLKNLVVYGDCFQKQKKNADYPSESFYSASLNSYKESDDYIGFGDYTILSEDFNEAGGPAYVVTIHLSYIDMNNYEALMVKHFVSYDDNSPSDPANKFKDALSKLVSLNKEEPDLFFNSTGLQNFVSLHESSHFPGLGQVKKFSIEHHVETVQNYISGI